MIIPPKAAMTRGTAVHSGIEFNYTQKMETKKDLPLEEVKEYTGAVFQEKTEETNFEGEDQGKVHDLTISLAGLYHEEVAPTVQPEAVEAKVEVAFEGTYYTLLGYIDLIDHKKGIRDTKNTRKTPSGSVIQDNLQFAA